jgi:hypothetical protein
MEAENRNEISGIFLVFAYIGRGVLLKWSFVAHTSVNVLLEKGEKYAGIYSCILAIYSFEYSTARMEYSARRNASHSAHYSKENRRERERVDPPCKRERKVATYGRHIYVN